MPAASGLACTKRRCCSWAEIQRNSRHGKGDTWGHWREDTGDMLCQDSRLPEVQRVRNNAMGTTVFQSYCSAVPDQIWIHPDICHLIYQIFKNWDLRSQPAPVPIHIVEQEVVSHCFTLSSSATTDHSDLCSSLTLADLTPEGGPIQSFPLAAFCRIDCGRHCRGKRWWQTNSGIGDLGSIAHNSTRQNPVHSTWASHMNFWSLWAKILRCSLHSAHLGWSLIVASICLI